MEGRYVQAELLAVVVVAIALASVALLLWMDATAPPAGVLDCSPFTPELVAAFAELCG